MGSTFHSVTIHAIFACKERRPLITPEIATRLYSYIGGVLRNRDCVLLEGGGVADHVHLLIGMVPRCTISEILRDIKANTSKWIHETWPNQEFAWQEGYGVFSVSISHIEKTKDYIRRQEEHHKKHSFEDELRRFKELHGLTTDDHTPPSDGGEPRQVDPLQGDGVTPEEGTPPEA
jgi:REP element-mobilizing transposase RayT